MTTTRRAAFPAARRRIGTYIPFDTGVYPNKLQFVNGQMVPAPPIVFNPSLAQPAATPLAPGANVCTGKPGGRCACHGSCQRRPMGRVLRFPQRKRLHGWLGDDTGDGFDSSAGADGGGGDSGGGSIDPSSIPGYTGPGSSDFQPVPTDSGGNTSIDPMASGLPAGSTIDGAGNINLPDGSIIFSDGNFMTAGGDLFDSNGNLIASAPTSTPDNSPAPTAGGGGGKPSPSGGSGSGSGMSIPKPSSGSGSGQQQQNPAQLIAAITGALAKILAAQNGISPQQFANLTPAQQQAMYQQYAQSQGLGSSISNFFLQPPYMGFLFLGAILILPKVLGR